MIVFFETINSVIANKQLKVGVERQEKFMIDLSQQYAFKSERIQSKN